MTRLESLMATLINLFSNFYRVTFGGTNKNTVITTATTTNGDWCAVQILSSTGAITSLVLDGQTVSLSGITFNQGIMIYGKITSITTGASTTVICYGASTITN